MEKYCEVKISLPNTENQNVINEFLLSLKKANKSQSTVHQYRYRLQSFFKERKERFSSITSNDIQQWLTGKQKDCSERTIQIYVNALRSFYNFCVTEDYIEQSPFNDKRIVSNKDMYWELKQALPNRENRNVISAYLLHLKTIGKNKQRIVFDRKILQLLFKDWKKTFSSFTEDEIQQWFNKQEREWKKRTIDTYINVLRSFYSFCLEQGYMEKPPIKKKRWVGSAKKYWEVQQPFANKQNQEVVNAFLLNLKDTNRSKKRIEDFRFILQLFFRERKEHFSSITTDGIQQWLREYEKGRKRSTVVNHLSFLRSFYRFCVKQGFVEQSPVQYKWDREGKEKYWELTEPLPNDENQKVINEFLLSMKVANMSENTIVHYRQFLWRFFQDKGERFEALEPDLIQKWFLDHQNKWKEKTISNYLGIVSSFYDFCVEEGYMEKSPIKSRWFPRLPKPVPKYLEKEEIAKVRLQAEKGAFRNRLIVEFLLVTGCRVSEVHRLNRADVDLENRTAHVLGKGKKIRTVHFTEKCALLLERYFESREDNDPALFVSESGTRLGIGQLHRVVKEIGKRARLSSSLHPHRLRHTFATELLAKGADLSFIADELGHENLQTTQIYAQLPDRELISMYRKYMG